MTGNDFALEFTSNADSFSSKLAKDLAPGVSQINELRKAIEAYDSTVGNLRTSNPLGGLFSQLDQAAGKLEGIGNAISGQFSKITSSLTTLSTDLSAALELVAKSAAASRSNTNRHTKLIAQQGDGDDISYEEALRRANAIRAENKRRQRNLKTGVGSVTDGDMSDAEARRIASTLKTAAENGREARNAVKRVADINATLARNATDSANALRGLGDAIRGLTTKTKTTTKGVEEGRFQNISLNVQGSIVGGGGANGIPLDLSNLQQLLASHGVPDAAQAPARDAAHAAERERAEAKREAERNRMTKEQWAAMRSQPAQPGAYFVGEEKQPRIVSRRLNPDETYGQYFERTAQNSQMLNRIRQDVNLGSEGRVGIQKSKDLQKIMDLIGRQGLEKLIGSAKGRELISPVGKSAVTTETIRASVGSVLAPGKTLTPTQYEQVPEALREFQKIQEDFARRSRAEATKRLQGNPLETFAFGDDSHASAFAQMRDFRSQVSKLDEEDDTGGAEYRRRIDQEVAEARLDRRYKIGARRDLQNPNRINSVRADAPRVLGAGADSKTDAKSREFVGDIQGGKARNADYDSLVGRIRNDEERVARMEKLIAELQRFEGKDVNTSEEFKQANLVPRARAEGIEVTSKIESQIAANNTAIHQLNAEIERRRSKAKDDATHAAEELDRTQGRAPGTSDEDYAKGVDGFIQRQRAQMEAASGVPHIEDELKRRKETGKQLGEQQAALHRRPQEALLPQLTELLGTYRSRLDENIAKLGTMPTPAVEDDAFLANAREQARAQLASADPRAAEPLADAGGGGGKPPKKKKGRVAAPEPEEPGGTEQTSAQTAGASKRQRAATEKAAASAEQVAQLTGQIANAQKRAERLWEQYTTLLQEIVETEESTGQVAQSVRTKAEEVGEKYAQANARLAARQQKLAAAEDAIAAPKRRAAAEMSDQAQDKTTLVGRPRRGSAPTPISTNVQEFADTLRQATQAVVEAERKALPGLTGVDRLNSVERAGTALRGDPAFATLGNNLSLQRQTLRTLLGLPRGTETTNMVSQVFARGGGTSAVTAGTPGGGTLGGSGAQASLKQTAASAQQAADALRRYNEMQAAIVGASPRLSQAIIGEYLARERLIDVTQSQTADYEKLAAAQRSVIAAQDAVTRTIQGQNPTASQKLFGQKGFGANQLRHVGLALENQIGFSLVFTGFDKLRELVQNGLESQVAFTRLQASLDANHVSAGKLRDDFQNISAETAQPLENVIEAAADLSGTLKNAGDIKVGTEVAAQLSLISQGALSAKEAAVGLRDVIYAFGGAWAEAGTSIQDGIRKTGDDIARLSQKTGVNAKDIIEGTTQLAPEAHEFGLNQTQTATLAAYVSRGTGLGGEESAALSARVLGALYKSPVQAALQRVLAPTNAQHASISQQFQEGDLAGILVELTQQWETLKPADKQAIGGLIGQGPNARAFQGIVGGGSDFAKALTTGLDDQGALPKQAQTYLNTILGQVKQLDEDFQNLGSTLQRIGAFDALGVLAKTADLLLKAFQKVGNWLASNPITSSLSTAAFGLGAGALGMRFIGSPIARAAQNTRFLAGITPVNAAAIAAAEAGTIKPRYTFGATAAQLGKTKFGFTPTDQYLAARNAEATPQVAAQNAAVTSLRAMSTQAGLTTEALAGLAGASGAATEGETAVAAASSGAAASQAAMATEGTLFPLAAFGASRGTQGVLPFGSAAATEAAAVGEQTLLPLTFRSPSTGRFIAPGALAAEDAARITATEGALPGMTTAELYAMNTGRSMKLTNIPAAEGAGAGAGATEEEAARAGRLAKLRAGLGGVGGAGMGLLGSSTAGVLGGVAAGYYVYTQMQGANQDAQVRSDAADRLLKGGTSLRDLHTLQAPKSFRQTLFDSGPFHSNTLGLHTLAQGANAELNVFKGATNALYDFGRGITGGGWSWGNSLFGGDGGVSDESSNKALALLHDTVHGKQGTAATLPKLKTAEEVEKYLKSTTKAIEDQRESIQKAGGNDKDAQAQIAYNITQTEDVLTTAAANRLAALSGLRRIDFLNLQQITDLNNIVGTMSGLSAQGLVKDPGLVRSLLQGSSLTPGSAEYNNVLAAGGISTSPTRGRIGYNPQGQLGSYDTKGQFKETGGFFNRLFGKGGVLPVLTGTTADRPVSTQADTKGWVQSGSHKGQYGSFDAFGNFTKAAAPPSPLLATSIAPPPEFTQESRLKAERSLAAAAEKSAIARLNSYGKPKGASDTTYTQYAQAASQAAAQKDQFDQALLQLPAQRAQAQASVAASLSGTGGTIAGQTFTAGSGMAVGFLNKANAGLEHYAKTLPKDSADFWQTLGQIEQNKAQIAQLQAQGAMNVFAIEAAGTNDAVRKASLQMQAAHKQLQTDIAGGASEAQIGQDRAGIAGARLGQAQAAQGVTASQYAIQIASQRNSVAKGQAQLNAALQLEAAYSGGSLRDQASYNQAKAQEIDARNSIADSVEAEKESVLTATQALATARGDAIGAAAAALSKAQQAYAYAVSQYHSGSQQANEALASLYAARKALYDAQTQQMLSGLDLRVTELNARGVGQGSDLGQDAARVNVQKARVALNRFLRAGGKRGSTEYNQLYGQLVTAQRNAFDVSLQAQLDTLDFQKQTYRITGAQEIASLQEILKNKQLTLAEQRNIILKIKGLQDDIRSQLTSGGLNIPSDIKLPTAYDVRRSLGAGFAGSSTQANVVNNNQTASVTIHQTIPNATMVKAVAQGVVDILNRQTGQHVRSNTSTPRNVPVGRK